MEDKTMFYTSNGRSQDDLHQVNKTVCEYFNVERAFITVFPDDGKCFLFGTMEREDAIRIIVNSMNNEEIMNVFMEVGMLLASRGAFPNANDIKLDKKK